MGFLKWLFGKKKKQEMDAEEEWADLVYERDNVDFHNDLERERYLTGCLEQIGEAQKELELLKGEYSLVTAYLTDMEEIEALPREEAEELKVAAKRLIALDQERLKYLDKKNRMSDSEYHRMESQETEIEEGIRKIREAEKYRKLIQQDMGKLEAERSAYRYRKSELATIMVNLRGMATICLTALGACIVMLAVLQFGFKMDTDIGFLLAVGAAAVAVTVIYVKYSDAQRELTRVEKAINKLILLQNKVKIRYVNNVNLLDYLYMKYGVDSGLKLEKLWQKYQQEKEERRQFAENEAKIEYYQQQLIKILRRYQLKDPDRWIHQVSALVDNKEMVEIRHELILRRQSLRSQMDYNQKVAGTASDEIRQIAALYPMYQSEITALVNRYEQRYS